MIDQGPERQLRFEIRGAVFFLVLGAIAQFFLAAALDAIFAPSVPMDDDWCTTPVEEVYKENEAPIPHWPPACREFKNPLQEALYHHNVAMGSRQKLIEKFLFAFWSLLGLLIFYSIPKWKGYQDALAGPLATAIALAWVVTYIAPLTFRLLPAPSLWFPRVFIEISDAQVDVALRQIHQSLNLDEPTSKVGSKRGVRLTGASAAREFKESQ